MRTSYTILQLVFWLTACLAVSGYLGTMLVPLGLMGSVIAGVSGWVAGDFAAVYGTALVMHFVRRVRAVLEEATC